MAIAALVSASGAARADSPAPSIPVVIVDLRPGDAADRRASREAFARELGATQGVDLVADPELGGALAAEPEPALDRDVRKRAADRMSALLAKRSADDCSGREAEARDALADLAALEAAGRKVGPELTLAYAYQLRCAHQEGDAAAAARAVAMLRALGHANPPAEVESAVWATYAPAAPAPTTAFWVNRPEGAAVWIDHRQVGTAPVQVHAAPGPHLIAAASGDGVGSQWIEVAPGLGPLELGLERTPRRWAGVRALVASWRGGSASANALAIARLMTETGVRYAVLLSDGDRAELWRLPESANAAERVRQAALRAPQVIGGALTEAAGATPPADAGVPILTEDAKNKDERKRQKWWVYAGIIGAVAVGAGIILANDLADDRQRIELTWP